MPSSGILGCTLCPWGRHRANPPSHARRTPRPLCPASSQDALCRIIPCHAACGYSCLRRRILSVAGRRADAPARLLRRMRSLAEEPSSAHLLRHAGAPRPHPAPSLLCRTPFSPWRLHRHLPSTAKPLQGTRHGFGTTVIPSLPRTACRSSAGRRVASPERDRDHSSRRESRQSCPG